MATLLDKAKNLPYGKQKFQGSKDLPEMLEVGLAYAYGEISAKQTAGVIPGSDANIGQRVGQIFLAAVKAGMLVRKEPL